MNNLPKVVAVLGPTASGKTDLGIFLAKKFNGEIVNFDSRQVYKKMNIGTAKPAGEWQEIGGENVYIVDEIPHYLMNIVDPDKEFTLGDFKVQAIKKINEILERGKLPILVGGTGLYFWAVIDNLDIPKVPPNKELRASLESKPLPELVKMLQELDPESAEKVDLKNPRRVLRALEVVMESGNSFVKQTTKSNPLYNVLQLGIDWPREELFARINLRSEKQMQDGLLQETESLVKQNYSWQIPSMTGIGYRQMGYYLRGEMNLEEAIEILKRDTRQYAKRQMTWFKRDKRIVWLNGPDQKRAEELVGEFIK